VPTEASTSETPAIFHKLIEWTLLAAGSRPVPFSYDGIYHTLPRHDPFVRKSNDPNVRRYISRNCKSGPKHFYGFTPSNPWKEFPMNDTKKQHGNKQNQDDKKNEQGQNPQKGQQGQHNQHSQHGQQDKEKGTHQPNR